jgi:hypothetical protein
VRRFLPELIDLIWSREIDPGKVFDLTLPLEDVDEGHDAMDERRRGRAPAGAGRVPSHPDGCCAVPRSPQGIARTGLSHPR